MIDSDAIGKALRAAEQPLLIDTGPLLVAAAETWLQSPVLGLDTEFVRERTYRADLGLVQISDGETAWLVDTVAVRDLDPLKRLLESPGTIKVFHSASEDLEVMWHTLGAVPANMIDTQIACALIGQSLQLSYQGAVKWLCGVEVDKEQTRSNWVNRPLRPEQLHYAATDVVFLCGIYAKLRDELHQHGRWAWLEEEVGRLVYNAQQEVDPDEAYVRMKGSGHLDIPSLRVLKRLAAWREETALRKNLARGFVIADTILLDIATRKPMSAAALGEIEGLHPRTAATYGAILLNAVSDGAASNEAVEQSLPLTKPQAKRVNDLRDLVQKEAKTLGLDPAILASRRQLEALIRAVDANREIPSRLRGWREPVITRKLLNLAAAADKV